MPGREAAPKFGQTSILFHGEGIQNHNGHLQAGRDIFINSPGTGAREPVNLAHRKEVLNSLKFEQMGTRQQSVRRAHAQTCQWFFDTQEYKTWLDKNTFQDFGGFLWVKGKPGAGKSTLMKVALDHTRQVMKRAEPCILSFFFNARGNRLEKSTIGLHRSLLVQFLKTHPESQHVLDNFEKGHSWSIESLKQAFENALQELGHQQQLIIFLDALDECNEREVRVLISWLEELSCGRPLHVCLASRHFPNIAIKKSLQIVLENRKEHIKDISLYVRDKLNFKDDRRLASRIRLELQMKASGIFMWVVLVIDMLQREYDAGQKHKMLEKLRDFPDDLHELFRDIFTQGADPSQGLLLCIQWLLFAKHPLTPRQLYLAIISGIEPGYLVQCHSPDISDTDVEHYILHISRGLAEITISWTSSVQLIHESIKDFLLKENGLGTIWQDLKTNLKGQSHQALRRCCSQYQATVYELLHQTFSRPLTEQRKIISREYPFLEYANDGVLFHADQAQRHGICQKDFLLLQFSTETWNGLQGVLNGHSTRSSSPNASLLYVLAGKNYSALIRASSLPTCFELEDSPQGTPLFRALASGNYDALQSLLDVFNQSRALGEIAGFHRVQNIGLDYEKLTPERIRQFVFSPNRAVVSQLVEFGCSGILKAYLSLKRNSIPGMNLKDQQGWTPLTYAAQDGDLATIRLLIERRASVNRQTNEGWTPLHFAVSRDNLGAAELLINMGANINAKANDGSTPLHVAMNNSQLTMTKMAKLLIAKGADAGLMFKTVMNGDAETVKLLLDCGADTNATCDEGRPWLFIASKYGHTEIIRILLDRGADKEATCDTGKTSLFIASQFGHTESVKLLLQRGADMNAICDEGFTSLFTASEFGRTECVRALLNRGVDTNVTCGIGRTPLLIASIYGHTEIVKLLLDQGADVEATCDGGFTSLYTASEFGYTETVRLLLDRGADIDATCDRGYTSLYTASEFGRTGTVRLLLDRGADKNAACHGGFTSLHIASEFGHAEIVKLLLDHSAPAIASSSDRAGPPAAKRKKLG